MPTRTPFSPWRWPCRFAWLRLFPECEVERVAFGFVDIYTRSAFEFPDILFGKFSISLEISNREKYVSIYLIGSPPLPINPLIISIMQPICSVAFRVISGFFSPRDSISLSYSAIYFRIFPGLALLRIRAIDDFVVYIGVISYEGHIVSNKRDICKLRRRPRQHERAPDGGCHAP